MTLRKIITLVLFFSLSLVSFSQSQLWKVTNSKVTFKIKNAGLTVNGVFSGLEAIINFDATKGFGNKIDASVDVKTINTNSNGRDTHLKKEEYFNADKFPKITMKASTFTKEADGKFKGFFTLTIKGISNTIPVIFSFTESGTNAKLSGSFKINRLNYKVGDTSWVLSDDVTINIDVDVTK